MSEPKLFDARRAWLNTRHLMILTGNGFVISVRFRGEKWNRLIVSRS